MPIRAIASDYDGTLATHGRVPASTVEALRRYRESGGELLLVTGREVEDLQSVFPDYSLFSWIVGENGALLYDTAEQRETLLAEPPPGGFIEALRARHIGPLYAGRVIVATMTEHAGPVQATIDELGLPLRIILNKDALMVLPSGVNKAFGLRSLLPLLELMPEEVAGVGDAENDLDLLELCGLRVAVENAIPELKEMADWVTPSAAGSGIVELIENLLNGSLTHGKRGGRPRRAKPR